MSNPPLPAVPWTSSLGARPRAYLLGSGDQPNLPAEAERLRPIIDQHVEVVLEDFQYQQSLAQSRLIWRSSWAATAPSSEPPCRCKTTRFRFSA